MVIAVGRVLGIEGEQALLVDHVNLGLRRFGEVGQAGVAAVHRIQVGNLTQAGALVVNHGLGLAVAHDGRRHVPLLFFLRGDVSDQALLERPEVLPLVAHGRAGGKSQTSYCGHAVVEFVEVVIALGLVVANLDHRVVVGGLVSAVGPILENG